MKYLTTFTDGPPIRVSLEFEANKLKKITLAFAGGFECLSVGHTDAQLLAFLEGYGKKKSAQIELPLESLSPFRQKALSRLQKVPFGSTLTYGQLAAAIDQPRAARAIGMACHYNPFPLIIPCHRVIASGGRLGGFAYDLKMKELLLEFESN
jgi:methylated-DNA-[protein]-cysteine S-methyltransferase